MDMSKVFAAGKDAILAGADDDLLGRALVDYVNTIRKD